MYASNHSYEELCGGTVAILRRVCSGKEGAGTSSVSQWIENLSQSRCR